MILYRQLVYCRLSTHILIVPSFFGINRMHTEQWLMDSHAYSFFSNPFTWRCSSLASFGLHFYTSLFGIRSIWCSIPLIDGSPLGSSFGNTSLNSYKSFITTREKEVSSIGLVFDKKHQNWVEVVQCFFHFHFGYKQGFLLLICNSQLVLYRLLRTKRT